MTKESLTILLFHRISPVRNPMWEPIQPDRFEAMLKYAKRKFEIVPLTDLIFSERNHQGKPLAAITFDDGYKDFIQYACPILKKYGLPSTLFVVTDCIERNMPTWTYLSDHYFYYTRKLKTNSSEALNCLPSEFQETKWKSQEDRVNYGKRIKQYLKKVPSKNRNNILKYFFDNFNDVSLPEKMMLSWSELRKISSENVEIGSHSVNHPTLATLEDERELYFELSESKSKLLSEIASVSPVFSYPCGSFNQKVKKATQQAGYKAALAVNGISFKPDMLQDLYEIPRIELYDEPLWKSKMRISGTIQLFKKWIK